MQNPTKPILRIRAIRESKGYTQEYMAEMLGVCQSTYAHLESGKSTLSIERLLHISVLLETDLYSLIEAPHLSSAPTATSPLHNQFRSDVAPEMSKMYEAMIDELRSEVQFLRSLIKPA